MTRKMRLVAALAVGAGLTAAGVAAAQTGSAAPPAASGQPTPPAQSAPAPSTPLWVQGDTPTAQPWDPNARRPIYSADPPADTSSGIYLPAVILGYARSAANCVVVGCDDGPRVGGPEPSSSGSSSGPTEPLPVTPGPYTPH